MSFQCLDLSKRDCFFHDIRFVLWLGWLTFGFDMLRRVFIVVFILHFPDGYLWRFQGALARR